MSIDERLRTGLARNTDHLVPDVEHELDTTYGRARVRRVRRGGVALAAVAAVATAIVWYGELPAPRNAEPIAPDPAPRSTTDLVGVRGPLEPGTYSLALFGETEDQPLPRAVFEVPEGYFSLGGGIIDAGNDASSESDGPGGVLQVWRVDDVLGTPCQPRTAGPVGPTATELARALDRQPGPSTKPIPTELAGHQGFYLEVTVPPDADLDNTCHPKGDYSLWLTGRDRGPWESGLPGIVHHLWILDVDGTRLVTVVSNYPDQPTSQHQGLIDLAETVRFEPAA